MSERVPEGWKRLDLEDGVSALISGQSPNRKENRASGDAFGILKTTAIDWGRFDEQQNQEVLDDFEPNKKHLVLENDILITKAGPAHRVGVVAQARNLTSNVLVSGKMTAVRVNDQFLPDFLTYALCQEDAQNHLKANTTGMAVSQTNFTHDALLRVPILSPSLLEQKKIASILTSVDEVIETTQKQIDKLQDLKKATMNELLTKGIGHTEFKDSGLGKIPKSWEVSRIGLYLNEFGQKSKQNDEYEVFTSSSKGLVKQSDYYGENRLTRRDNIGFNIIPEKYITYRSRTDSNKFFFNQNNLNATGLVSKYYPVFTHKKGVEFNHFITSLLNFHSQKFANEGVGTSQVVLSFNALKFVKLAVPPLNEQLEIAKIISGVDENLRFMSKKLVQTQSLKKSLMQDLLTGKVRVQVN